MRPVLETVPLNVFKKIVCSGLFSYFLLLTVQNPRNGFLKKKPRPLIINHVKVFGAIYWVMYWDPCTESSSWGYIQILSFSVKKCVGMGG